MTTSTATAAKRSDRTTLYTTTGTSPVEVVPGREPGTVHLYFEDGSGQVYDVEGLLAALRAACPEAVSR